MIRPDSLVKRFIVVAVSVCLLSSPVMGLDKPVQVGVLDFPPYYVVDSKLHVSGSMIDKIRKTLEKAGYDYKISGYPSRRLYKNLAEGVTDVWIGLKSVPDYEGKVLYGDVTIEEIQLCLYTLMDKPLINSIDGMKGKRIITLRGYGYGGLISFLQDPRNKIDTDPTEGHVLALKKLMKGRGDYLLDYRQPVDEITKNGQYKGLVHSVVKSMKVHFVVSKKAPEAENLLRRLETAYLALKKEGTIR